MRIDSHQHFWVYDPKEHVWMGEEHGAIKRNFGPDDLGPLLSASGFDGCIAVQARQSLAETDGLLKLAREHAFIRGVVGWVDLRSQRLEEQLEKYVDEQKLVGVRHVIHDEADDRFMLREDFRRGLGLLEGFALAYDLLLFPKHLKHAAELADEFPRQRFVLDHIGKPAIRDGALSPWREDIRRLAARENVWCKLSGMVTEAKWGAWKAEDFWPYLDVVMEAFGPGRCMVGSDWPVCTVSGDYGAVMGIVEGYAGRLSPSNRQAILGGTCAAFYRVEAI